MKIEDDENWPEGLDDALRRRAARVPAISPEEASHRVRARIGPRPSRHRPVIVTTATVAAVLALALTLGHRDRRGLQGQEPRPVESTVAVEPLPENVVQWWLDPQTPVYFVVGPPTANGGGPS